MSKGRSVLLTAMLLANGGNTPGNALPSKPLESGHAPVNGIDMYYEVIFASSITRRDGAHPQLWEFMKKADFSNMPQPLKDAFLRVNPDAQKLRTMHDKDAARMQGFKDVPDDLVRSVRAPADPARGTRGLSRRSRDDAEGQLVSALEAGDALQALP